MKYHINFSMSAVVCNCFLVLIQKESWQKSIVLKLKKSKHFLEQNVIVIILYATRIGRFIRLLNIPLHLQLCNLTSHITCQSYQH